MPLGIDATIRYALNNWTRPLRAVRAADATRPYNTRKRQGLPPTPIGNPGLASIKAAPNPAERRLPLLRRQAVRRRRARVLRRPTRSSSATSRRTTGRATRTAATTRRTAEAAGHDARLGVLGWPVAHSRSPAMHNAALRRTRPERLALPAAAGPARALRGDRARAGGAGFVGANVTIPHKEAALALADEATRRGRARSVRPTRSPSATGEIHADNTDAPGLLAALSQAARAGAALVLGRRRQRASRGARARDAGAARCSSGTGRPSARGRAGASRTAPRSPADLLVNCTSVGLDVPKSSRDVSRNLPVAADGLGTYATVVDLVYRQDGDTELVRSCPSGRLLRRRWAGDPGPPGRAEFRVLDRPAAAPLEAMRGARGADTRRNEPRQPISDLSRRRPAPDERAAQSRTASRRTASGAHSADSSLTSSSSWVSSSRAEHRAAIEAARAAGTTPEAVLFEPGALDGDGLLPRDRRAPRPGPPRPDRLPRRHGRGQPDQPPAARRYEAVPVALLRRPRPAGRHGRPRQRPARSTTSR